MELRDVILKGPYFLEKAGLSVLTFGELVCLAKEFGPGRYPVVHGMGGKDTFHLVLYEDHSWRVSTAQLDLFCDSKSPHTLT